MPRVNVPVTAIVRAGVVNGATGSEVTSDSTNHHYFANDERTFLHVRNTDSGAGTVILQIPVTVDGQTVTGATISIPATSQKLIGPFPNPIYQQPSDAPNVWVNVSTNLLKLQAFKI
jgi:hypothetical protein